MLRVKDFNTVCRHFFAFPQSTPNITSGAVRYGMKNCFYNRLNMPESLSVFEIFCLWDLEGLPNGRL